MQSRTRLAPTYNHTKVISYLETKSQFIERSSFMLNFKKSNIITLGLLQRETVQSFRVYLSVSVLDENLQGKRTGVECEQIVNWIRIKDAERERHCRHRERCCADDFLAARETICRGVVTVSRRLEVMLNLKASSVKLADNVGSVDTNND